MIDHKQIEEDIQDGFLCWCCRSKASQRSDSVRILGGYRICASCAREAKEGSNIVSKTVCWYGVTPKRHQQNTRRINLQAFEDERLF